MCADYGWYNRLCLDFVKVVVFFKVVSRESDKSGPPYLHRTWGRYLYEDVGRVWRTRTRPVRRESSRYTHTYTVMGGGRGGYVPEELTRLKERIEQNDTSNRSWKWRRLFIFRNDLLVNVFDSLINLGEKPMAKTVTNMFSIHLTWRVPTLGLALC